MVEHGFESEELLSAAHTTSTKLKELARRPVPGPIVVDPAQHTCADLAWTFMKKPASPKREPSNKATDLSRAPRELDCAQLAWSFFKTSNHPAPRGRSPTRKSAPIFADPAQHNCSDLAWSFMKPSTSPLSSPKLGPTAMHVPSPYMPAQGAQPHLRHPEMPMMDLSQEGGSQGASAQLSGMPTQQATPTMPAARNEVNITKMKLPNQITPSSVLQGL